jgi:hypothetical protein
MQHRGQIIRLLAISLAFCSTAPLADFADDALALTGGRQVKIAYLSNGSLKGYDTDTRKFTTIVSGNCADIHQGPYISPDGRKVAYFHKDAKTHVVNWDGSGDKAIAAGRPARFWKKPSDGSLWVYIFTNKDHSPVRRYSVSDPSKSELAWDKSTLNGGFGVSADGTHAGSMEWPNIYYITSLPNGAIKKIAGGCWPDIAPDNSYRMFYFDNGHSTGHFSPGGKINFGESCYYPRWSTDACYFTYLDDDCRNDGCNSDIVFAKINSSYNGFSGKATLASAPGAGGFAWVGQTCSEPPSVASHPADLTVREGESATFSVSPGGCGSPDYQWLRNGSAISGATSRSYTIENVSLSDNGAKFSCKLTTPHGSVTSNEATVTVQGDTEPPTLVSVASGGDPNSVIVTFSEPLSSSAEVVSNYTLDNGASVQSATRFGDFSTVKLTTSELQPGISYTLTVGNVTDASASAVTIAPNPSSGAFTFTLELTNHDFETGDLTGWTVVSGDAFSAGDVTQLQQAQGGNNQTFNQHGSYHLWGFKEGGDKIIGVAYQFGLAT